MIKFRELIKIYFKKSPVTLSLITINTLMFLVTVFTGGFTIINLVDLGGLVPAYISEKNEYYRLIMPMFLHGGFFHFFMNSYFLFYIGSFVEKILGSYKYLFVYLLSGIGSNVLIWLLGDPLTVTIGASGALFGIMGLLLVLTYTKPQWFPYHTVRNIRSLTIINLIFTFLIPNISIYGHLGGFICGVIFAFILNPKYPQQQKQQENTYYRNYQNQDNIFDYKDVVDDDDFFKN